VIYLSKKENLLKSSIVIGSALFSMFFGAGNIIFPSYLGFLSGNNWFGAFIAFYIVDIVLAIIALLSIISAISSKNLFLVGGKFFSNTVLLIVAICLGPLITVPRTASTTYELSVLPLTNGINIFIFNILFFLIVFLLTFKKNSVIDIIGKILTPLLLLGLIILIIKGVLLPTESLYKPTDIKESVYLGIDAGYQSMDVFASVIFGGMIINSIRSKTKNEFCQKKIALISGLISGTALLFIYLGLTYLGYKFANLFEESITRAELIYSIVKIVFKGKFGPIFFSILVALACLSTAIAVVSSIAEQLSNSYKKIGYTAFLTIICVISALMASFSVENIVAIGQPILQIIYPPVLVAIFLSFFNLQLKPKEAKFLIYFSAFFATLHTIVPEKMNLLSPIFPFVEIGLGWTIPIILATIIFIIYNKIKKRELH